MIRSTRNPCGAALVAALVFAAACGGNKDDNDETRTGSAADDTAGEESAAPDESEDDDAPPAVSGEPSTLLADELHALDLPEPGTAVVTLAGETYVFDELGNCRIVEDGEGRWTFSAGGGRLLDDGSRSSFSLTRSLVEVDVLAEGSSHERDFLQMTVEQEPGTGMFSNAVHEVSRAVPGGPVEGDGDVLPVIRVIDDGGVISATAVAELALSVSSVDRAGEGIAEFAMVCD